jgi:hypothetical protein
MNLISLSELAPHELAQVLGLSVCHVCDPSLHEALDK